jgi:hypothetical protein
MSCTDRSKWTGVASKLLRRLEAEGIVARHDLPLLIYPDDVDSLEGWDFTPEEK